MRLVAASYIATPSLFIFAAYIQLTEARTSGREVARAQTRLVSASPSDSLAIATGSMSPLIGCSPIEVARPVKS